MDSFFFTNRQSGPAKPHDLHLDLQSIVESRATEFQTNAPIPLCMLTSIYTSSFLSFESIDAMLFANPADSSNISLSLLKWLRIMLVNQPPHTTQESLDKSDQYLWFPSTSNSVLMTWNGSCTCPRHQLPFV
jgi:hypothetical protein